MRLEGSRFFRMEAQALFPALLDPAVLAAVTPGCERLEVVEGRYQGAFTVRLGPVRGHFSSVVEVKEVCSPERYTMLIEGRGAPGFVRATAEVRLAPEGRGTRLTYDADALVGGPLASVKPQQVAEAVRAVTEQGFDALDEALSAGLTWSTVRARYRLRRAVATWNSTALRYGVVASAGAALGALGTWLALRG